jgi:hypothetical protein
MSFSAESTFFSPTYPDVCSQTRPTVGRSGYTPTSPGLTQSWSGLVYVEHWWGGEARQRLRRTYRVRCRSGSSGSGENGKRSAERRRGTGRRGRGTPVPPHARLHGIRRRGVRAATGVFCSFICHFLGATHSHGTGLGGGQRNACNATPSRGQRRGNGQKCTPP